MTVTQDLLYLYRDAAGTGESWRQGRRKGKRQRRRRSQGDCLRIMEIEDCVWGEGTGYPQQGNKNEFSNPTLQRG